MWYYISKSWIYLNLLGIEINTTQLSILSELKSAFKSPKLHFWCGKRKNFPFLFGFPKGKIFSFIKMDLQWKDKYETPRHEENPQISITLFGFTFLWYWSYPGKDAWESIETWEQILWYLYYCDKDIKKAEETWPWQDMNNKSTWIDDYVKR